MNLEHPNLRRSSLTVTALALTGCASLALTGCASTHELTWHCAGGSFFKLHYDDRDQAVISASNRVYKLPLARSASGARYSDGTVEYWEHQGEATLTGTIEGPYRECKREGN